MIGDVCPMFPIQCSNARYICLPGTRTEYCVCERLDELVGTGGVILETSRNNSYT